ncbi:hypothetical protein NBT05_13380 [Aquimarina sp. ERC-38]|uniref:hypothetical protein n=1 Tax=Aquimarina sp. ERC-38 TaxID=2949996 RepID=UPI0022463857|nr:hypothetical protein [Aquimarina sp. ERC-38]UZO79936.1 hypothetical protein NBT05_13380 [Aquimarina sp. ERC-38]
MKRLLTLFVFILFINQVQAQREVLIRHHLFIPQYNTGAVKSMLFDYFGDNFQFQGKRKVWREKEKTFMYVVSIRDQKLKIYYKGFHDEMKEKLEAFYADVLQLADY